ncbi:uncharacterized protein LOC129534888 [Moschus berezovskii]|uniref:uncharacterized protein LOC129534888 n=1 Tax=Moschus berezovskii TaxID=68408 RepID=UPI00244488A3|nr:uncharacterized protein LOC129534888 [Moschus berezovskii]
MRTQACRPQGSSEPEMSSVGTRHIVGAFPWPRPPLHHHLMPGFRFLPAWRSVARSASCWRNVRGGRGPGPRRKAALWAKAPRFAAVCDGSHRKRTQIPQCTQVPRKDDHVDIGRSQKPLSFSSDTNIHISGLKDLLSQPLHRYDLPESSDSPLEVCSPGHSCCSESHTGLLAVSPNNKACSSLRAFAPAVSSTRKTLLPGHLPNPGIEHRSPALRADSLPAEPPRKPDTQGKKVSFPACNISPLKPLRL